MALEDLAGYSLRRRLGSGSAGTLWQVRDLATGRHAVLRRVPVTAIRDKEQFRDQLIILQRVNHPHLARVLEVRETPTEWLVFSRYVVALSLTEVLRRRGTMSPGEIVTLLSPLADALHFLHHCGLIHGHLTPPNVLIDVEGRPILTDATFHSLNLHPLITPPTEPPSPAADLLSLSTLALHAGGPATLFTPAVFTQTPAPRLASHLLTLTTPEPIILGDPDDTPPPTATPPTSADTSSATTSPASGDAPPATTSPISGDVPSGVTSPAYGVMPPASTSPISGDAPPAATSPAYGVMPPAATSPTSDEASPAATSPASGDTEPAATPPTSDEAPPATHSTRPPDSDDAPVDHSRTPLAPGPPKSTFPLAPQSAASTPPVPKSLPARPKAPRRPRLPKLTRRTPDPAPNPLSRLTAKPLTKTHVVHPTKTHLIGTTHVEPAISWSAPPAERRDPTTPPPEWQASAESLGEGRVSDDSSVGWQGSAGAPVDSREPAASPVERRASAAPPGEWRASAGSPVESRELADPPGERRPPAVPPGEWRASAGAPVDGRKRPVTSVERRALVEWQASADAPVESSEPAGAPVGWRASAESPREWQASADSLESREPAERRAPAAPSVEPCASADSLVGWQAFGGASVGPGEPAVPRAERRAAFAPLGGWRGSAVPPTGWRATGGSLGEREELDGFSAAREGAAGSSALLALPEGGGSVGDRGRYGVARASRGGWREAAAAPFAEVRRLLGGRRADVGDKPTVVVGAPVASFRRAGTRRRVWRRRHTWWGRLRDSRLVVEVRYRFGHPAYGVVGAVGLGVIVVLGLGIGARAVLGSSDVATSAQSSKPVSSPSVQPSRVGSEKTPISERTAPTNPVTTPATHLTPPPTPRRTGAPPPRRASAGRSVAEWLATLRSLDVQRAQAFRTLDAATLDKIYVPGSPPWQADRALLADYRKRHIRIRGLQIHIDNASVAHQTRTTVTLRTTDHLAAGQAVDRTGTSTRLPPGTPTTHLITLTAVPPTESSSQPGWRIRSIEPA